MKVIANQDCSIDTSNLRGVFKKGDPATEAHLKWYPALFEAVSDAHEAPVERQVKPDVED